MEHLGTTHVRVRKATRDKLDAVAKRKDWTRVVAADKAADALLEKEGVRPEQRECASSK